MALKAKKAKRAYGSGASLIPEAADSPFKPLNVNGPSVGAVTPTKPAWTPPSSDSTLEDQYSAFDKQAENTSLGYRKQAGDLLRDYGYQADPNNPYGFGAVDPTNAFSKAALLKQSFDQAQSGNKNSYAARGQLYAGSLQNAQNRSLNQYQAGDNALKNSLGSNLGALNTAEGGIAGELAAQKLGAYGQFLSRRPPAPEPLPGYDPTLPQLSTPAQAPVAQQLQKTGSSHTLKIPAKKKKGKR